MIDSLVRGITTDYEPFGAISYTSSFGRALPSRQTFIDKEKDGENGLGDFGVRKYEEETGRFMSVDALWAKYPSLAPFVYAASMPTIAIDRDGREVNVYGTREFQNQVIDAWGAIASTSEGRKILRHLMLSKEKLVIRQTEGVNGISASDEQWIIDGKTVAARTVAWNPKIGFFEGDHEPRMGESGTRYPPILELGHELVHAYVRSQQSTELYARSNTEPGGVRDAHEDEVISRTNIIAHQLGYRYRSDYAGTNYVTKSPTSISIPGEGVTPPRSVIPSEAVPMP